MPESAASLTEPRRPLKDGEIGCEWSPDCARAAQAHSEHYRYIRAVFSVDAGPEHGTWRLCASCAQRAPFKAFRRVRLGRQP